MNILLRESQHSDMPFMREMLYEAVFWRPNPNKPSFEEGLAAPGVSNALVDWGERDGDIAVIALVDSTPAGAAWYRFYTDDNSIRGYIEETIPALAIAVHKDYRRLGIGERMINWLIDHASKHNIQRTSLMVSKDNHAINLYRKCGFLEHADKGDSLLMLREIMTNNDLIKRAASVIKVRKTKNGLFGDVGCALLSAENKVYVGICADSGSNAFCAEQNAIGSMITDSVYRINKIVAVWKDEHHNVHVISPCGNCRQLMLEIDKENLGAEVILDHDKTVTLEELLPYHTWWKKQEKSIAQARREHRSSQSTS